MKIPKRMQSLVEDGLIEGVTRQLMSGKEASVYVVRSGGEICCAKVYKSANNRSFRHRANYEEGRRGRNSRRARAMAKRTKFGKQQLEESWESAEVDAIYKLARAGVRVPRPYSFSDGVLVMELVVDEEGHAAPRLNDISLTPELARRYHAFMMDQVVRMLCAGLIHGDLSEYNVLVDADGPVVIDFPQAVDAAGNLGAKAMLLRDVENMTGYFARFAPEIADTRYGQEIWALYERGDLHPEVELTGRFAEDTTQADVAGVLRDIDDAREEHERRSGRKVVDVPPSPERAKAKAKAKASSARGRAGDRPAGGGDRAQPTGQQGSRSEQPSPAGDPPPQKKRRRRRRKRSDGGAAPQADGRSREQSAASPSVGGASVGGAGQAKSGPKPGDAPKTSRRRRRRRRRGSPSGGSGSE